MIVCQIFNRKKVKAERNMYEFDKIKFCSDHMTK